MSIEVCMQSYDERKNSVLALLEQTGQFLRGQGLEEKAQSLDKLQENVEKDLFSIVLVGEFSAGKSTFLNALMHRRILPSFTSETTATVNFLRHRDQAPNGEAGIVYYSDGHTETLNELSLDTVAQVVSTKGDREDGRIADTVDHVDLFLDSKLLQNGVMLVDSPGLNGVAARHQEITERQIMASHASIFMFNAERPGSRTDFEYLRDLKNKSNNIFFVMNKINAIRANEGQTVESVVEGLRATYHNQFPDETQLPKIWPVAGDAALAARDPEAYYHDEPVETPERRTQLEKMSRLQDFEDRLWQYLTQGEKARAQLRGPVESCIAALSEQREYLETQLKLLESESGQEELEKQRDFLQERLQELERERKKTNPDLLRQVNQKMRELKESATAGAEKISERVLSELERKEDLDELNEYARRLHSVVEGKYRSLTAQLDDELRNGLMDVVQENMEDYFIELEDKFQEVSEQEALSFQVGKLELNSETVSVGLAQFEEERSKLEKEMEEQEEQLSQMEQKSIAARIAQRKLDACKAELNSLQERRDNMQAAFVIPDSVERTREVERTHKRGGLFGIVANVLFGEKYVGTGIETYKDSTDHDEAIKERDQILKQRDQEIEEAKKKLKAVQGPEMTPEEAEHLKEQARRKLERLEKEYDNKIQQFNAQMDRHVKKMRDRLKDQIVEHLETYSTAFSREIRGYLDRQRKGYEGAVRDLLNTSLDQELQQTSSKLESLLQTIKSNGDERRQRLEAVQGALDELCGLLGQGAELSARLEAEMDDHIEQEAL